MRWEGRRQSSNVSIAKGAGILSGGGMVIAILYFLLSGDPGLLLDTQLDNNQQTVLDPQTKKKEQQFVAVVLADTEDVWNDIFKRAGMSYREPGLVMFERSVSTACGMAGSAVGPFYCPGDQKIYLDLSFFKELSDRLGAGGDFAQAYVIAHEVGHHVQHLLGTMDRVSDSDNAQSVRLELQADCYAGLWAQRAEEMKQILEEGDIDEALSAAAAVGDDRLQMQSQGYVVPDSFTHGSAEQRMTWFRRGFAAKNLSDCDTFGTAH